METIHPKILTDSDQTPVAVQIDYAEWLAIEPLLRDQGLLDASKPKDALETMLDSTKGIWKGGDGLEYQLRIRAEWDDFASEREENAV